MSMLTDRQSRYVEHLRKIAPVAYERNRNEPLFRFMRYTSDEERRSVDAALVSRLFKFGRPRSFNDPFDNRPSLRIPGLFEWTRHRWYLRESLRLANERFPGDVARQQQARDEIARAGPDALNEAAERRVRATLLDNQLMLCLCGNRTDIRMWSHYAGKHCGVVVHLDPHTWPIAGALKVSYSRRYPTVSLDIIRNDPELSRQFSLLKGMEWSHEDEYRVLVQDDDPDRFGLQWSSADTAQLSAGAVTAVTVGCLMDPQEIRRVVAAAQTATPKVPVYRAVPHRMRFWLNFELVQ